jgi:hypothetical protein
LPPRRRARPRSPLRDASGRAPCLRRRRDGWARAPDARPPRRQPDLPRSRGDGPRPDAAGRVHRRRRRGRQGRPGMDRVLGQLQVTAGTLPRDELPHAGRDRQAR